MDKKTILIKNLDAHVAIRLKVIAAEKGMTSAQVIAGLVSDHDKKQRRGA